MKDVNFFSACLTVDFFEENGYISDNRFFCPAFLEKYEPTEEDEDYRLLRAGSAALRGQGSLGWFTLWHESYKMQCEAKAKR